MNQTSKFRASISNSGLAGLYDLWDRLRRERGRLPYRRELGPLDLPSEILPSMLVLEREPSGRFRCRLAGTAVRDVYQFEATGWYLDQVMPSEGASVRARIYERVLHEKRAALCRLRLAIPDREFIASDRLYVPALGDETGIPTVLLTAQVFLYASELVGKPDEEGVYHLRYDDPLTE